MTFKEYLEQEVPKRRPSVYVTLEDAEYWSEKIVRLNIHGEIFEYLKIDGGLWTQDEDGNPLKRSVFLVQE